MSERSEPVAVLFDLDGVLIDSFEAWFRVVNRARRAFGFEDATRETFAEGWGQGVGDDIDHLFPGRTFEEVDGYFTDHLMKEAEHIVVDPDAKAVLERLREDGHPLAIVTNTRSALAAKMLTGLGLADLVDACVASGDVPRDKPAPDMVLEACWRLEHTPDEAVMVGDSRFDREAARAANVLFVGFRAEGDRSVDRLAEIPDLLAALDE
jgi:phosphoglycolate phosphatase/AHBA synthesis associated protein